MSEYKEGRRLYYMPFLCKNLCSHKEHQDVFIHNSKINKTGIDVLFCRACNIFIRIKEAFKKLNIFKNLVAKNRCDCCGAKLRTNVRTRRQKQRYKNILTKLIRKYRPAKQLQTLRNTFHKCGCGCGFDIPLINKKGEAMNFKQGHRKAKTIPRHCLYCGSDKTQIRKNTNTPRWFKAKEYNDEFICYNCYMQNRYSNSKNKKIKLEQIIIAK